MQKKRFYLLPVVLCACVALTQQYLANTHHLSAWRGGGFGMFSSIDDVHRRRLLVEGVDEFGARCEVKLPLRNQRIRDRILLLPNEGLLKQIGMELLSEPLIRVTAKDKAQLPVYRLPEGEEALSKKTISLKSVRVSVWRPRWQSSSESYTWEPITPIVEVLAS